MAKQEPQRPRPEAQPQRPPFLVVPAVDLLGDEAVRLERGDFGRVALRAGDPADLVARFASAGAALIHVVDLDGARYGRIRPELVARLVSSAAGIPVQASGGIRTLADAEAMLEAGAARVVVGTASSSPSMLAAAGWRSRVGSGSRSSRPMRPPSAAQPRASPGSTAPRSSATGR
jgi:phosphoribosylformimino-5-aminoimidazole carboxamide ribonucleotide (ProFAR) isomerase